MKRIRTCLENVKFESGNASPHLGCQREPYFVGHPAWGGYSSTRSRAFVFVCNHKIGASVECVDVCRFCKLQFRSHPSGSEPVDRRHIVGVFFFFFFFVFCFCFCVCVCVLELWSVTFQVVSWKRRWSAQYGADV
uniref:Uncharacterized protein n=1 Tax=Physcomitrium patens TaxID=3218 RepID=A0A2K1KEY5_PHYPA|nr:hypothetical protein PHYPA_008718 [Physcomitrium patens]